MERLGIIGQLMSFFWKRRKFWLLPVILFLIMLGALIVISESSVVGSLIYTLF